jgi:protein-arginine kinase activator protein McsA
MLTEISPKTPKYFCDYCNIKTNNKKDYEKHLTTQKHSKLTNVNKLLTDFPPKDIISDFICENCNKEYKSRVGLWKHKKICAIDKKDDPADKDQLILMLIKQNSEFQNMMMEQQKQILEVCKNGTNNTNNSINNSHNKTFNLQFFLNEECKDALNIAEFVSSIKVQLEDLETTGRLGYVEGVSRIINKNLNDLDQTKRPIHCSDAKREVLYIKNDDQWVKENETKPILTKAIRQIANENIKQIGEWKKKYPDCTDSDSRKNDMYLNIVSNAMSGTTVEEQSSNYEKIISKVAKEVVIEK